MKFKIKKIIIVILLMPIIIFAQNKTEAEKKVNQGVELHDQGKYLDAITLYDDALKLDKDNLFALSEKAMTLDANKQHQEAIEVAKLAIKSHPNEDVKNVYVTYASALDHLKLIENSIQIFDEGISKYPNYYSLHYNKGITLVNAKQFEKANLSFQSATHINPNHANSLNALAVLGQENRIPAIMASSRYLILDNKSQRAKVNFDLILKLMGQGVSQKEDKSISVVINSETVDKANSGKIENDFSSTDLILSMSAALDYDDTNKDKSNCRKFIDKFETICQSMNELKKDQKGYYWQFLAPYFIEMQQRNLVEPFAYAIWLPSQDNEVLDYHKNHSDKIQKFYDWSKQYKWN